MNSKSRFRVSINSPVILGFVGLCFFAIILNILTAGRANYKFFSVYRSSLLNPLTYFRLFGHVLGHSSWAHFFDNIIILLICGPAAEEKYGSKLTLKVILITAFVTGLFSFLFRPGTVLLGASGEVFAFILLGSFSGNDDGIPLTFILVAVLYFGSQVYQMFGSIDNVSYITHIIGGIVGSAFGFMFNSKRLKINVMKE